MNWFDNLDYYSECMHCNGYYGKNFGQPVCSTCHLFLYSLNCNTFRRHRERFDKAESGDSGNEEVNAPFSETASEEQNNISNIKRRAAIDERVSFLTCFDKTSISNKESLVILPPEVLIKIFEYLDDIRLLVASKVCVVWSRVIDTIMGEDQWRVAVSRHFPLFRTNLLPHLTNWKRIFSLLVESTPCMQCLQDIAASRLESSASHSGEVGGENSILLTSNWRFRRLTHELKAIYNDPPQGVRAEPLDSHYRHWQASITGPPGSPYEGGIFFLHLQLSDIYPMAPPAVRFLTKVIHPNVSRHGDIGLDSLHGNWSLALTISKVLISIQSLLTDPYLRVCMEPTVAELYRLGGATSGHTSGATSGGAASEATLQRPTKDARRRNAANCRFFYKSRRAFRAAGGGTTQHRRHRSSGGGGGDSKAIALRKRRSVGVAALLRPRGSPDAQRPNGSKHPMRPPNWPRTPLAVAAANGCVVSSDEDEQPCVWRCGAVANGVGSDSSTSSRDSDNDACRLRISSAPGEIASSGGGGNAHPGDLDHLDVLDHPGDLNRPDDLDNPDDLDHPALGRPDHPSNPAPANPDEDNSDSTDRVIFSVPNNPAVLNGCPDDEGFSDPQKLSSSSSSSSSKDAASFDTSSATLRAPDASNPPRLAPSEPSSSRQWPLVPLAPPRRREKKTRLRGKEIKSSRQEIKPRLNLDTLKISDRTAARSSDYATVVRQWTRRYAMVDSLIFGDAEGLGSSSTAKPVSPRVDKLSEGTPHDLTQHSPPPQRPPIGQDFIDSDYAFSDGSSS